MSINVTLRPLLPSRQPLLHLQLDRTLLHHYQRHHHGPPLSHSRPHQRSYHHLRSHRARDRRLATQNIRELPSENKERSGRWILDAEITSPPVVGRWGVPGYTRAAKVKDMTVVVVVAVVVVADEVAAAPDVAEMAVKWDAFVADP